MGSRRSRITIVFAAAMGALALMPAASSASKVSVIGNQLEVTNPANAALATTVSYDAATNNFNVTDGGGPMLTGSPCTTNPGGTVVSCPATGIKRITMIGGSVVDDFTIDATVSAKIRTTLRGEGGPDALNGGTGGDRMDGGDGGDTLNGGGGPDRMNGGDGDDGLNGGPGRDTMDGGDDADTFNGGSGFDFASYASRTTPIKAKIGGGSGSGNFPDGPIGARDTIGPNVEGLVGTSVNDLLLGSPGGNILKGRGGRDTLKGKAGRDVLSGGARRDLLLGGNGPDRLIGGSGPDDFIGGNQSDRLFAVDNEADASIDCGPGAGETARVDALDPAPMNC
jgi:Ca2+-binding RTX toxin-like protein